MLWHVGQAFREAQPTAANPSRTTGSSESVHETDEERLRRYNWSGQEEVSDPDLWARIHYGPGHADEPMRNAGGEVLQEFERGVQINELEGTVPLSNGSA